MDSAHANGKSRPPEIVFSIRPDRDTSVSITEKVARAAQAQPAWSALPLKKRLAMIRRLRSLIAARAESLALAVQSSRPNPLAEILAGEVLPLADACRFLEREAPRILRTHRVGKRGRPLWLTGVQSEIRREPLGTILVVGPFNYPLFLPGVQCLQALVAGNAVLLKPGQGGGPAATAFVQLCVAAGIDPQLLQLLPESPEAAEAAIAIGIDKLILTGSARTGEKVLGQLAPQLIPAVMELSGCDAAFVRPDADLELVARALRFALVWNGGATCICPRRIFVSKEIAPHLESLLVAAFEPLAQHAGRWQLDSRSAALVYSAIDRGARPLTGVGSPSHRSNLPTIVADANVDMPLLHEDILAPVMALVTVANEEEALAAAEKCPFALGATVFGERRASQALAARIRAGVVVVNDVIVATADPRLPFGGRGRSGFGSTRGAEGLLEMTAPKVISVRHGRARHLDEVIFSDHDLVRHYIDAIHGERWIQRWRARWALLRALIQKGSSAAVNKGQK